VIWWFGNYIWLRRTCSVPGLAGSHGEKYGRRIDPALRLPKETNTPHFFGISAPIGTGSATIKNIYNFSNQRISRSKMKERQNCCRGLT